MHGNTACDNYNMVYYRYGGHTHSVLCTVLATIGPGCSVVYMGHAIPHDATSDRMAETGSIYGGRATC